MKKVLFMVAPIQKQDVYGNFAKVGSSQPPLGLLYIAAAAREQDLSVDFYDASLPGRSLQSALEKIETYRPELLALSMVTFAVPHTLAFLTQVKQKFPDLMTVVGGPHVNALPDEMIQHPCVDFSIVGDGEHSLPALVKALGDPDELKKVPGLYYKDAGGVHAGPPNTPIENLDTLPFPAWDLLDDLNNYRPSAINYRRSPNMAIFTSRGCPFNCVFCNSSKQKGVRYHSVERVLAEIRHLVDHYGVKEILINDDTFTVDKERVFAICEGLNKIPDNPIWVCNIQVSTVTRDMLAAMKNAGCWLVMPGVESGNSEVLKIIKKKITLEKVVQVCAWARELGLWVKPSFILGHPSETKESIEDTINFARKLWCHYPSFTLMTPFPGTALWEMADDYGTVDKSSYELLSPAAPNPPFIPKGLSREYLLKKQKEAFWGCYFSPAMMLRHIFSIKSWEDIKRYGLGIASMLSMKS